MREIDPITLSVLAGRMEQIADEMDATLFRAAFNPIIAEAHDASHGLYHACLLYTSPSPRDLSTSRMPSSA